MCVCGYSFVLFNLRVHVCVHACVCLVIPLYCLTYVSMRVCLVIPLYCLTYVSMCVCVVIPLYCLTSATNYSMPLIVH